MKRYVLVCLLICLSVVNVGWKGEAAGKQLHKSVIGIIGPMEEEVEILRSKMDIQEVKKVAGYTFYKGTLDGKNVVLVRSGIGKVNSSVSAQILITMFGADYLINSGVAGGLNPKLKVGDIVISSDSVQHDVDQTAIGQPLGKFEDSDVIYYKADKQLIRLAQEAAKKLKNVNIYLGRIASGDQFVGEEQQKKKIVKVFNADAVEMEGAAIGQVAYLNGVPYVIIRAISDKAGTAAGAAYASFVKLAAKNASTMIETMIQNINGK
ncbi:5'-methylthioadenosine/adenosylhomocysteine nucleosidase [Bacillus sp. 165]|uniref:5'-methylthioadenosine/adenosylhomocysteine nucleosidase n=1 Tax=Bacillus sp. 165 TaxID=1529117 RepID=UPI001ADD17F8|nr:5'-methylthioadenosine/adenosylhomocysteine nucleosidase [Bacillus sp. 165]MBO9129975.1 5'-methylthioadenosine/adenosylhomocysteine nucleosidase [Bacillus sp. 165]